jgi:hypothetical protein
MKLQQAPRQGRETVGADESVYYADHIVYNEYKFSSNCYRMRRQTSCATCSDLDRGRWDRWHPSSLHAPSSCGYFARPAAPCCCQVADFAGCTPRVLGSRSPRRSPWRWVPLVHRDDEVRELLNCSGAIAVTRPTSRFSAVAQSYIAVIIPQKRFWVQSSAIGRAEPAGKRTPNGHYLGT